MGAEQGSGRWVGAVPLLTGGGGVPSRLTWDWFAVVRQDEVIQAHDAPRARLPGQEDLRAGAALSSLGLLPRALSPRPTPRTCLSLDAPSRHHPSPAEGPRRAAPPPLWLAFLLRQTGLPEGPWTSPRPCMVLPSPASPERDACSGCQRGPGPRRPPVPRGACAAGQRPGGRQRSASAGTPGGSRPRTRAGSDRR